MTSEQLATISPQRFRPLTAAAAIDLLTEPVLLEEAGAEFLRRTKAGYTCPIPEGAVPVIPE